MRTREVLRFELGHQARQPATWLYGALLLGLPMLLVAGGANPVGTGNVFNAPLKTATYTVFVGLLGTLVTAGLFVEAGHRDVRWRMEPLFHTSPLRRGEYLGGRFLGALLVNALLLLLVPAALLVGTRLLSVEAGALGPFRIATYLLPYVAFLLPNLLVNAAALFGVTVLSRRALPGYLGAVGLAAVYLITANLGTGPESSGAAALLDPTGLVALTAAANGWTRAEVETRAIDLTGIVLWNRLLWTTVGVAILAYTWRRFRLAHAEPPARRLPAREADSPEAENLAPRSTSPVPPGSFGGRGRGMGAPSSAAEHDLPPTSRSFGIATRLRQTREMAGLGLRQIVASRDFALVSLGLLIVACILGSEALTDPFGGPLWPTTHLVATALTGRFIGLLVTLLTVFYAGELVWRERDARMEALADAAPVADWVPLVGKLLALAGMLAALQVVLMAAGIGLQLVAGAPKIEPGLYLAMLVGIRLPESLLFAVLALLLHVLVNQRYVGYLAGAVTYLLLARAPRLGVEDNLLIFGADPGWVHSDMAGFGPFAAPFAWFKLHWAAWAMLMGVAALLFWTRGTEGGAGARIRLARRRITRRVVAGTAAAAVLVVATGGFILHNTHVRNVFRTAGEMEAGEAEYERRYARFADAPQPWLTDVRLDVELHPERRAVAVRGTYRLVNRTGVPIDSVHLSTFPYPEVEMRDVRFDRPAAPVLEDAARGFRIYALARPLLPGDSLRMDFAVGLEIRGFQNRERRKLNTGLAENGTYLEMMRLFPAIGYQRDLLEVTDAAARRRLGLPARGAFLSLDDTAALRRPRTAPHADWIDFEAVVGTAGDQTAVLPGTLRRTWTSGGRRYFHYRSDAPVLPSISLMSARYAVREARWNGVTIRVLHHPDHAFNVDRTVRGVRAALELFGREFGPYPHRTLSVVEIPGYDGTLGRAMPAGLVYTEGTPLAIGRMDEARAGEIDTPLLLLAHEIGHQWWGHQLVAADVEGSQVLSETLAQYGAALVLERERGPEAARRFLRSMHLGYLDARGTHASPEVPLLRSGDQEHIHYRKGVVALYALRAYVGEARVSAALRNLLRTHAMRGAPYPTTRDLHRQLLAVTPDSLRPLVDDLLATITLWDLRATSARAVPVGDGAYRVTLDVDAAKLRADSVGRDRAVPMDDLVEIGVFASPRPGERTGRPLYLAKHRVDSGRSTITVTVRGTPARAGIDPHRLLVARHRDALLGGGANMADVEMTGGR